MNKRQSEVLDYQRKSEEQVLKDLKKVYKKALDDIDDEIAKLKGREENETENLQSIIYQKQYQQALKQQINGILDTMNAQQFTTISDYLAKSYESSFVGTMYDLHGQGIPLVIPINQNQVVQAVQVDSKLSKSLYETLGEDVNLLKTRVRSNIARGFASGQSYSMIAKNISSGMVGDYSKMNGGSLAKAYRITRTEGHRIQQQAADDVRQTAKSKGADIVKQWDSTLDGRTRDSHRSVDGEIRELDEKFSNGLLFPCHKDGIASEVVNCRCACLQRARWGLDEEELQILKDRAEYYGLDKTENFEEFQEKYLEASKTVSDSVPKLTIETAKTTEDIVSLLKNSGWYYETVIDGKLIRSVDGIDLQNVDFESAKLIYESQKRLFEKYPNLIGKLNGIRSGKLDLVTFAECYIGSGHGGVCVNQLYFKNINRLIYEYDQSVKSGFHPSGTDASSIITHEFGHALDDLLSYGYNVAGFNGTKPKRISALMRPRVLKSCGMTKDDIGKELSDYATKNADEWFAECFAEYLDSDNPREMAKEFGKQLEEILKGIDWNAFT